MPSSEPNFYADDLNFAEYEPQRRAKDRQAYCELFAGAAEGQLLGEMSGAYLFSERAVPNILKDSWLRLTARHPLGLCPGDVKSEGAPGADTKTRAAERWLFET